MFRAVILAAIVGAIVGAYEGRKRVPYVPEHLLN